MKFLRFFLAFLFGAFGGFLIYLETSLIFITATSGWLFAVSFLGGWALTTHWVVRGTTNFAQMFSRMFLLSAILSFALTPALMILSARIATMSSSGPELLGSFLGGGLISGMGMVLSLGLTFLSLVGFGLMKLLNQESGLTTPCLCCAEPIHPKAKKCKHCGEFMSETQPPTPTTPPSEECRQTDTICQRTSLHSIEPDPITSKENQ